MIDNFIIIYCSRACTYMYMISYSLCIAVVKFSFAGGFEIGHTPDDEIASIVSDNQIPNHVTSLPWKPDSPVPQKFYAGTKNCNPHDYEYLINHPHLCLQTPEVFLLVEVKTEFAHFDRRMTIRETWATFKSKFPGIHIHTVFLFGRSESKQIQDAIRREDLYYKDIIQEDFVDSHQNLSLKTVMGFKWSRMYCPYAKFVMLVNDDVVLDLNKLIPLLKSEIKYAKGDFNNQLTICYYFPCCAPVSLNPGKLKYGMHGTIYGGSSYPAFCSGSAYVAPSPVIHKLYLMSLDTPRFMPADIWVGILIVKLGIQLVDTHHYFAGMNKEPTLLKKFMSFDYSRSSYMIGVAGNDFPGRESTMMRQVWQSIEHHQKDTQLSHLGQNTMQMRDPSVSGILYLTVSLMLIDILVVTVIFVLIFYKKGRKKK